MPSSFTINIIWKLNGSNIVIQDGTKAKKVEYNVYSKLSGKNVEKLNLTICENTKINSILVVDILMIYVMLQLQMMERIYH